MKNRKKLGSYIAARRKYMHLTQEELADTIGVSKSAVAKWETDGGIPDRDNLLRLSAAIHVSVDDLHHVINGSNIEGDSSVNITAEVIELLESYGYEVRRPEEGKER